MITKKEQEKLIEWLYDHNVSSQESYGEYVKRGISACGLIEHEPTAKEKYERTKKYSGFVFKNIPGEWFSIEVVNDILNLADAAIKEAEEGARK